YHERHQLFEQSLPAAKVRDGNLITTLKPAFDLSGIVRGPDGKPIAGATVRAVGEPAYNHNYLQARTDADGKFLLPRIAPTKLRLSVQADHLAPQRLDLDITEKGGVKPQEIQLA